MSLLTYLMYSIILCGALALGSGCAFAQDSMSQAVKVFNAGKFDEALPLFNAYTAAHPKSAEGFYYLAVCHQKLKNHPSALKYYDYVIKTFPGTQACTYSLTAAVSLNESEAKAGKAASANGASKDAVIGALQGPDEDRVPFRRGPNGHLLVMARINGRPIEMMFDTGASGNTISIDDWTRLGYPAPTGPATGQGRGVGGYANLWSKTVTLEIGKFKREVTIDVTDKMKCEGLIGQTFFKDLQYNLSVNNYIHIFRPGAATAKKSIPYNTIDIPFRRVGNELVVTAKVNGLDLPAYFDTGAYGCMLDSGQMYAAGLRIPRDASPCSFSGMGGKKLGYRFRVESFALGDVVKRNFEVTASSTGMSLIGQDFFKDRPYVVDNEKCVIHFFR